MDKIEKNVFGLICDVKDLKEGQIKHDNEIQELKDIVTGVFRVEIRELNKRVTMIEKKLGIK